MNRCMIDTDIISYYLKGDEDVVSNCKKYLDNYDVIDISLITYYEITSGLLSKQAFRQLNIFEEFVCENNIIPLTDKSAKISAEIYASLKQSGNVIDDIDILIAGIAIENGMTLVTNNVKHFSRIPGLKVENWKKRIS